MTQEALAQACQVTRQTIIALEAGRYAPSLELAFRIAHALFYIADKSTPRSLAYAGGFFTNVAIFALPVLQINFV